MVEHDVPGPMACCKELFCLALTTAWGLTGQLEEIPKELDHAKIAPKNKEEVAPAGNVIGVRTKPINRLSTDGPVSMTTHTQILNRASHALTADVHVVSTQDHVTARIAMVGSRWRRFPNVGGLLWIRRLQWAGRIGLTWRS